MIYNFKNPLPELPYEYVELDIEIDDNMLDVVTDSYNCGLTEDHEEVELLLSEVLKLQTYLRSNPEIIEFD